MKRRAALFALALPLAPRPVRGQTVAPHKIGLTIALSGAFANTTAEYLVAYQMGVETVNRAGGIAGRPLQLFVEDSQGSPEAGIAAMRKLVQIDGVEAMLTLFTNVVTAQIPLADQLQMPTMAVVEVPGVVDKSTFVFANGVRVAKVEPLLRDYWKQHGFKRLYAFLSNNAGGQGLAPGFTAAAQAAGAESAIAFVNVGDADFRGALARAKDFAPDGIYLMTSGSAADGVIIRQARDIGLNQQFFMAGNFYTIHAWREAAGPYAEGMIFGGKRVDPTGARGFIRAYRARTGFEPGYAQGEMYDNVRILAYALARGGGTPAGIRGALATLTGLPSSLGGMLSMGPDHYTVVPEIALWHVQRGLEVKLGA